MMKYNRMKMSMYGRTLTPVLFLVWNIAAFAGDGHIQTHLLENGMKILVQEDHSIPNVALYLFYRIGSRNEKPGTTGISHFFEHMMFNGAKKYGPGEFDVVMEAAGGSNNAYTNQDVTVYTNWFPRSDMELIFDLESDRIRDLSFDPEMIESERGVVASERRASVDANPSGILYEQLWALAYAAHPYQWPVIGWMADIETWTADDLKAHFEMGYSPANALMVVVGDVTQEEVVTLAKKYLEPIPSKAVPPPVRTVEPKQTGERRAEVFKFAQIPVLMMGYHIPESAHPDYYPLRVLETVLFSGESSRMYKRVIDQDQTAISIDGGFSLSLDPTLFVIHSQPKAGHPMRDIELALFEELEKLKTEPVPENELTKAKNILAAEFYRKMKTISGKANSLGSYEVYFGDYKKLSAAVEEYRRVTPEDLKRVAGEYFSAKNRTVVTLIPETESSPAEDEQ